MEMAESGGKPLAGVRDIKNIPVSTTPPHYATNTYTTTKLVEYAPQDI